MMMALGIQAVAVAKMAIRSAPRRPAASGSTIAAIALVVLVLLGFLSMGNGFRQAIAGAGVDDIAVVLRDGATSTQNSALDREQLTLLGNVPGIKRGAGGDALVSPEIVVPVSLPRNDGQSNANLIIRGISPESGFMLRNVTLVAGRPPQPGTNELIVGEAASQEFRSLSVNSIVRLAGVNWRVSGVFSARGSVYESEARADLHVLQPIFRRGMIQSVRAELEGGAGLRKLQRYLADNPRSVMVAQSESDYFRRLSKDMITFVQRLGWPLALLMSVGALAGAANAMYTSVEARRGEIVTLRTLGYGRIAIFLGVIAEALVLAAIGAGIGIALGWAVFDGMHTSSTAKALGQVAFEFRVSLVEMKQAILLALSVGLLGGLVPALNAAYLPLANSDRE